MPNTASQQQTQQAQLARRLGLFDAIMLVMGGIIGAGIFINPYVVAQRVHTPALIMGASPGAVGTARMQYHLRQTMVFLNMYPLNRPEVMINNCVGKFDEQGNLADEKSREYITKALGALVAWTRKLKG